MLIDTHCHIHSADYPLDAEEVIDRAHYADVMQIICVGTDSADSRRAVDFANIHDGVFAAIGIHPENIDSEIDEIKELLLTNNSKIVAIGEIGLDYYYGRENREKQINLLEKQIEIALDNNLPISFHVREAYDDFWPIINNFASIRGVIHCFTGTMSDVNKALSRGLYFGLNGISTFTRDEAQKKMFNSLPLDRILLETDSPFLTPDPLRGKIKVNEPAYVRQVAEHDSMTRQISFNEIATATTANARSLFNF